MNLDNSAPDNAYQVEMGDPAQITVIGPQGVSTFLNFVELCPVPQPCGAGADCPCADCTASVLAVTPRNGLLVNTAVNETFSLFLNDRPFFEGLLPAPARDRGEEYLDRFQERLAHLSVAIGKGRRPELKCTADEMLLHIILNRAERIAVELRTDREPPDLAAVYDALPAHLFDANISWLRNNWFDDYDVLELNDVSLEEFEARYLAVPDSIVNPANWFQPFHAQGRPISDGEES